MSHMGVVYDNPIPRLLRWLGASWRDSRRSYRMRWGELAFGRSGWALQLCLFDERRFSLNVHLFWVNVWVSLPFLSRWAWEPEEMMEAWGATYTGEPWGLHLRWGARTKIVYMPWRDWVFIAHEVRRADDTWVPYVGSWERDKEPDGRATEQHPYRYLTRSGEKQEVTATIHAERWTHRLRWLRHTRLFQRVRYSINVEFSDEVGERRGSWKGGVIGCGYDLLPDETPVECLRRMESERRFER